MEYPVDTQVIQLPTERSEMAVDLEPIAEKVSGD